MIFKSEQQIKDWLMRNAESLFVGVGKNRVIVLDITPGIPATEIHLRSRCQYFECFDQYQDLRLGMTYFVICKDLNCIQLSTCLESYIETIELAEKKVSFIHFNDLNTSSYFLGDFKMVYYEKY